MVEKLNRLTEEVENTFQDKALKRVIRDAVRSRIALQQYCHRHQPGGKYRVMLESIRFAIIMIELDDLGLKARFGPDMGSST